LAISDLYFGGALCLGVFVSAEVYSCNKFSSPQDVSHDTMNVMYMKLLSA